METSPHMYDTGGGGGGSNNLLHKLPNGRVNHNNNNNHKAVKSLTQLTNVGGILQQLTTVPATAVAGGGGPPPLTAVAVDGELAELTSSEISLDLQGLIDDTHFGDDNLFGDLVEAKKNELNHGYGLPGRNGGNAALGSSSASSASSSSSSGHSSPNSMESPPSVVAVAAAAAYQYRNALAYLPGSVHSGATYGNNNNSVQVKQEPIDHVSSASSYHRNNNNNNHQHNNSFVSSTTPTTMANMSLTPYVSSNVSSVASSGSLPSLKSFATVPKYLQAASNLPAAIKKKMDRNSDDYRRRRERNNVAVRKSREKAKMRTRDTEERVKILARENERLQKKVELLQEELSVLRSLFSNVGVLPEHIHRELSKHMDSFQQQHNAMACM